MKIDVKRLSQSIAKFLRDFWPQLLILAGGLGAPVCTLFWDTSEPFLDILKSTQGVWGLIFAISFIIGNLSSWLRGHRLSRLENEVRTLEGQVEQLGSVADELIHHHLKDMAEDLQFSNNERISIYYHECEHFILLARYSKNPEFDKSGRLEYPDNEGSIGKAWREGESYATNLPDFNAGRDEYLRVLKDEWGIDRRTAQGFKMKSRCLYARAVEEPAHDKRIGVIVFESMESSRFALNDIRDILSKHFGRRISQLVPILISRRQCISYARREGF